MDISLPHQVMETKIFKLSGLFHGSSRNGRVKQEAGDMSLSWGQHRPCSAAADLVLVTG